MDGMTYPPPPPPESKYNDNNNDHVNGFPPRTEPGIAHICGGGGTMVDGSQGGFQSIDQPIN